jgi:hypothetical protein
MRAAADSNLFQAFPNLFSPILKSRSYPLSNKHLGGEQRAAVHSQLRQPILGAAAGNNKLTSCTVDRSSNEESDGLHSSYQQLCIYVNLSSKSKSRAAGAAIKNQLAAGQHL